MKQTLEERISILEKRLGIGETFLAKVSSIFSLTFKLLVGGKLQLLLRQEEKLKEFVIKLEEILLKFQEDFKLKNLLKQIQNISQEYSKLTLIKN